MNDKGEMTKEGTEQIKKDLAPINTKPETNHAGDGIEANSSNKVSTGKAKNHLANSSKSKASGFRPWDSLLLEVCAVILLAIYFRRLWILHLLSYLFIGRILKLAFAWYSYFFDTGVIHNISHLVRGFSHTAFKEMDKIFQGDALRLWLASSSIQFVLKIIDNKNVPTIDTLLNEQYKHVNKLVINEMNERIDRAEKVEKAITETKP